LLCLLHYCETLKSHNTFFLSVLSMVYLTVPSMYHSFDLFCWMMLMLSLLQNVQSSCGAWDCPLTSI